MIQLKLVLKYQVNQLLNHRIPCNYKEEMWYVFMSHGVSSVVLETFKSPILCMYVCIVFKQSWSYVVFLAVIIFPEFPLARGARLTLRFPHIN